MLPAIHRNILILKKQYKHPDIIYKYRNWTDIYHKNTLLKNQIYLSSPKDFNDPLDCRIPINYSYLQTGEQIDKYVNSIISKNHEEFSKQGVNIEIESAKLKQRIIDDPKKFQKWYESIFFEEIDIHYGIYSMSEEWNSLLMWTHYANNHQGVCIGFWQKKLLELNRFIMGRVIYPPNNVFPDVSPFEDDDTKTLIKQTNTKSNEWQYEKEYRLTTLYYPLKPTIEERTYTLSNDFFAEIIIGMRATEKTRTELLQIAKDKKVSVFEIRQKPFKFEIERVQLL
jgi:hypothetical protein